MEKPRVGMEVGGLQSRRENDGFGSTQEKLEALKERGDTVSAFDGAEVLAHGGGTGSVTSRSAEIVAAAAGCMAAIAPTEASAHGTRIAATAIDAFASTGGERAVAGSKATAVSLGVEGAGVALGEVIGTVAPVATNVNWEERLGMDFAGSHSVSVGVCGKHAFITKNGFTAAGFQEEADFQRRVGIPLTFGGAGVGGNIGRTERVAEEHNGDNTYVRREASTAGEFAGEKDTVGIPVVNLDIETTTMHADEYSVISGAQTGDHVECTWHSTDCGGTIFGTIGDRSVISTATQRIGLSGVESEVVGEIQLRGLELQIQSGASRSQSKSDLFNSITRIDHVLSKVGETIEGILSSL